MVSKEQPSMPSLKKALYPVLLNCNLISLVYNSHTSTGACCVSCSLWYFLVSVSRWNSESYPTWCFGALSESRLCPLSVGRVSELWCYVRRDSRKLDVRMEASPLSLSLSQYCTSISLSASSSRLYFYHPCGPQQPPGRGAASQINFGKQLEKHLRTWLNIVDWNLNSR